MTKPAACDAAGALRHARCRFGVAAWVAAVAVSSTCPAQAGEPEEGKDHAAASAYFAWVSDAQPPPCMTLDALRGAVSHVLGRPVSTTASSAEVQADVRFDRAPDAGWNVRIRRLSRSGAIEGERFLHGADPDCASLLGATSLVLAMVLDRPARPSVLHAPPPSDLVSRRWGGRASAGARAAVGMLPGLSGAVTASADVVPPGWIPIRWTLAVWPGSETREDSVGGRFRAWSAGLGGCPTLWKREAGRIEACGGIAIGSLSATGVGLSPSRAPTHFWGHAEVSVEALVRVAGPFGIRLGIGALAPWNRPRFVYESREGTLREVHRSWAVSPFACAALEIDFGP
jgi:hypothetical protein